MIEEIIIEKISKKFKEEAGIVFRDCDLNFLKHKITEHLKLLGISSIREYFEKMIINNEIDKELDRLFMLVINKESYFFRYKEQFELLKDVVLPEIILRKYEFEDRTIKIWSSGISRGEEPYTIAMVLEDSGYLPKNELLYKIISTDIVEKNIKFAQKGEYDENIIKKSFKNFNNEYLLKYFISKNGSYFIKDELKSKVEFKVHNLIKDPYFQVMDIIFCRNVIIYFDDNDKEKVLRKLVDSLVPGGYLFLGHSETPLCCTDVMRPIFGKNAVCYKKVK